MCFLSTPTSKNLSWQIKHSWLPSGVRWLVNMWCRILSAVLNRSSQTRHLKGLSSEWVNMCVLSTFTFRWQTGHSCFCDSWMFWIWLRSFLASEYVFWHKPHIFSDLAVERFRDDNDVCSSWYEEIEGKSLVIRSETYDQRIQKLTNKWMILHIAPKTYFKGIF